MVACCRLLRCAVVGLVVAGAACAQARSTSPPTAPDPSAVSNAGSRINSSAGDSDLGVDSLAMRERRENMRKVQRKERLTASANRLLELTKQFEAEVSERGSLTPADERKLDEIAKAAREVRSRMAD